MRHCSLRIATARAVRDLRRSQSCGRQTLQSLYSRYGQGPAHVSHFQAGSCYFATQYNTNAQHRSEQLRTQRIKTCSKWNADGDCRAWKYQTVPAETCDQHAQGVVNYYHSHYMGGGANTPPHAVQRSVRIARRAGQLLNRAARRYALAR